MNLLGSVFYDPTGAAAVSKATTALLAMTALDTTNLRVTFTVPLSGKAWVKVAGGALHGAATYPVILVGILNGATVVARQAPQINVCGAAAATTPGTVWAEFVVSGLTPGASLTWDLAYGVEQIVALTGWKYGGPNNNTTAGDAFGGISFEVWDPSPVYLPAAMPTATVGAAQTNIQGRLPAALVSGRMDSSVGAMAADVLTAAATAADFGTEVGTAVWAATTRALTDKTGFGVSSLAADTITAASIAADAGTEIGTAVWATTVRALTDKAGFSLTTAPLDAAGTRAAVGLATANLDTQLAGISAKTTNLPSDPADASDIAAAFSTVNGTLSTISGYIDTEVAAIKTDTAAIKLKTDNLPASPAAAGDVTTVGAAVAALTAPDNAGIAAVKAKTDSLAFTVAGQVDVNLKSVAGSAISGTGTLADPWGP